MDVPVTRTTFRARSPEETWETVGQLYTHVRPTVDNGATRMDTDSWSTPQLAVDATDLRASGTADAAGLEQFMAVSWLTGRSDLTFHRADSFAAGPGDCCLMVPGLPYRFTFDVLSCLTVRLPLPEVDRAAHELTGTALGALRFTSARPLSVRHGRLWDRTATYLRDCFAGSEGSLTHPLIHRQLVDHAAAVALATFPNTTMSGGRGGPGTAQPAVVRRAVEYIDAHAGEAITISDVAAASRIGVRGLQAAFRRHRDEAPLQYLRRVRLERSHRDLQDGDPTRGDTVAAVAARWGFAHPGRFSVEYREFFGCSPSETLRG